MNRRIIVLLVLVLVVLTALVGFFLYLSGGEQRGEGSQGSEQTQGETGLIHVRTIYVADGENLRRPTGLGAADNGDFFITLKDDSRVIGFDRNGDFKVKWGESGIGQGQMLAPLAVAVDRLGNHVYVIDRARLRILCYNLQGLFQWEQPLLNPVGITMFGDDVAVTTFGPIVRMSSEGEIVSESGTRGFDPGQFDYPRSAVQMPGTEELVVADTNNTRVQRVALSGEATATAKWIAGVPPRYQDDPATIFGVPSGVTVDDKSRVFVLDGFRHTINVLDPETGEVEHTFKDLEGNGDGQFKLPTGIVHLHDDYFAVTDTFNDRVQIIRLLLPGEDTLIARLPWLIYLLPLPLLLLLIPLFRKRVFVTRETLELAQQDEKLRLLAGAFKKLRVLPEVAESFSGAIEQEVEIGPFLLAVGEPPSDDGPSEAERLAKTATARVFKRLFASRRLIICSDQEHADQMRELAAARVRDYAWVLEEYRIR